MPSIEHFHEQRGVGLCLTFLGAMIDVFTYLHFQAFASGQTGNLILAFAQLQRHDWVHGGKKLLVTLSFFLGILLAKWMTHRLQNFRRFPWRLALLYCESLFWFGLYLGLLSQHPSLVMLVIAFLSALRWICFDKIEGLAYTHLFTTGNLKALASSLFDYASTKTEDNRKRFEHYLSVVLFFLLGLVATILSLYLMELKQLPLVIAAILLGLALRATSQVLRAGRS